MQKSVGITLKIFALSSSILLLLVAIAVHTHHKIKSVNQEIDTLAQLIFPAVQLVDEATIAMLEQEVHFERILKLYEFEPEQKHSIDKEINAFNDWGGQVDQKIAAARSLIQTESDPLVLNRDTQPLRDILPVLAEVAQKHQHFQHFAIGVFNGFKTGETLFALHKAERLLTREEDEINTDIEQALLFLQEFTINAAQQANDHQKMVLYNNLVLAFLAIVVGLIYAGVLSRQITAPLQALTHQVNKVLTDQTLTPITVSTHDEVGQLTQRFNQTLAELRHSEKLKDLFGKYLDPRLIADLEHQESLYNLDGEKQMVTILLSQLDGLEINQKQVQPDDLVSIINEYLAVQLNSAAEHQGMLSFVLTEILTFWSHPFSDNIRHNQLACDTFLQQLENLPTFREKLKQRFPTLEHIDDITLRVGITSGSLVVANLGPSGARSFTVIGDEVNSASRLQGVARYFGVNAVVTEAVATSLNSEFLVRPLGKVLVQGKDDALEVFELLGRAGPEQQLEWLSWFTKGFEAFNRHEFAFAITHFHKVLGRNPNDNVTQKFLQASQDYQTAAMTVPEQHEWVMVAK